MEILRAEARRVIAFTLLGYAYVVGVFSLGILVPILFVVFAVASHSGAVIGLFYKVAFPFLYLSWTIVKAMFVRLPEPTQRRLLEEEAPLLFAEVERMRREVRADRVHEIRIDDSFNAAMSSVPRFGILGGSKNRLLLGYPLLALLSPVEARSVIAHELGHSAREHGRLGVWVYKQHMRWANLYAVYSKQGGLAQRFFARFLNWYFPRFEKLNLELARSRELEADQVAAQLTSPEVAKNTLFKFVCYMDVIMPQFWSQVWAKLRELPEPPTDVFEKLALLPASVEWGAVEKIGRAAAASRALDPHDTHPPFSERARALGGGEAVLVQPGERAAAVYFGAREAAIAASFSASWRAQAMAPWKQQHAEYAKGEAVRVALGAKPLAELAVPQLVDLGYLEERFGPDPLAARAAWREVLRREPENSDALFLLGRSLLQRGGDAAGAAMVERSMLRNPALRVSAHQVLLQYFAGAGDSVKAARHQAALQAIGEEEQKAFREREKILLNDELLPHGLPEAFVDRVRALGRSHPAVKSVYLARKKVFYHVDSPVFVLGYEYKRPLFSKARSLALVDEINQLLLGPMGELPGKTFSIALNFGNNGKLKRKFLGADRTRVV
jgi:Zn-dependent protease with chaperone function